MEFPAEKRSRLGEMLVEANLISAEQLNTALEYQKKTGGRLGEVIEKLGFVQESIMVDFIARQQDLEIVKLDEIFLPENLIKKIPQNLIEKYTFLPIGKHGDILTIALSDPTDYEAIEEIQLYTNLRVEVVLAPRSGLRRTIDRLFHKEAVAKSKEELLKELEAKPAGKSTGKDSADPGGEPNRIDALIGLLIEKNIITSEELNKKAKDLRKKSS